MTADADLPALAGAALRDRAVRAALGEVPFDLEIAGGTLVDAVTGELRAADIGIVGPLVASVHQPGEGRAARATLDARGAFVAPGLIDTHMHVESSMVTPAAYAAAVLPRGVTTVVWDPHELANVGGLDGVRWAAEASRGLPLRVVLLAPSCVPSAPGLEVAGAEFGPAEIAAMLAWPEIAGVAEMMDMRGVLARTPRAAGIVAAGLASGKPVHGHARGLAGAELAAYAAAGVTSDHELVSGDDLAAKLRAGLTIELRGSHDHLLPDFVAALRRLGRVPQTVTLCTDDVFPDDLFARGGLDDVVRRLVGYGLPAVEAVRAASLNAAMRLGRGDLGLVAPGRRADLAVFEDLAGFRARHVVADGMPVARDGALLAPIPQAPAGPLRGTMKLGPLADDDFRVRAAGTVAKVAVIDRPRFPRWASAESVVADGVASPPDGTILMAVAHRHGRADPRPRLAFLGGWGPWRGAFATTVSHDSHNLTVFGGNPRDMRLAANAVIAAGGGLAVAAAGELRAVLPLPLGGLLSDAPLAAVAEGFGQVREAADAVAEWSPPYRVFKACFGASLACNAGPHLTDRGIADLARDGILETPVLGR